MPALQLSSPALLRQRISRQLQRLQRKLAKSRPHADDIHDLRVTCKQLRSWLHLLRHHGADKHWQPIDKALQALARAVAAARDRVVLKDTLVQLQTGTRSPARRTACQQVLAALPSLPAARNELRHSSLPGTFALVLLDGTAAPPKVLHQGLKRTQVRCRRLARAAFNGEQRDSERLHRLRRWVKYLAWQLELVTDPMPASERWRKQLVRLGHLLGQLHDLAELQKHKGSQFDPLVVDTFAKILQEEQN